MYVDKKTLKDLEWSTILKHLARHATSEAGKRLCHNLLPDDDVEDVKELLNQTTEATKMLQMALDPPFGGVFDIADCLSRASVGSCLDNKDFVDIGSTLNSAKRLKAFFDKHKEPYSSVYEISSYMMDHDRLITEIYKCFDISGNIQDTASSTLKHLKDSFREQSNNLKDKLNAMLSSRSMALFLQEPVYTIRNDRYVLPVKAEHKSDVPGIVHDSSASGVTYYIEPRSIVELNNKLKETELKIEHEIQRILQQLTIMVAQNADNIVITLEFLATLDLIFAKAKYSHVLDAAEPQLNEKKIISLKRVRHPILITNIKKVISNNVELGGDYNNLIITGANTGGKTVLLKAMGLCILMAGAGMHIPADVESSLYLFPSVFSDIGEEQSLEHNLSTFSAKMSNIINIVNKSNGDSLVLLDELGAGTDPAEGTALAQAILESLDSKGAHTVVTTHYGGLKTLAFSHQGFSNASVEFDVETLTPTYRLQLGMPGKSNATTIAKNLGLSAEIISRAEHIYKSSVDDFSLMIDELQKIQREITREYDQARLTSEQAAQLKEEYETLLEKINISRNQSLSNYRRSLNNELNKAKSEVIKILEQLKVEKTPKSAKRAHSKLAKLGYEVNKQLDSFTSATDKSSILKPVNRDKIKIGDTVYIEKLEQDGVVISMPDNNDKVIVQMGLVKTTVKISDLRLPKKQPQDEYMPKFNINAAKAQSSRRDDLSVNLDLRGKRVDEGLAELEIYLDRIALVNVSTVYVIHGHGSGAMKKAVRDYLANSPYVKDFRPGGEGEGGDGISIVELK
ncbi:MAG: endonuclease MutS2 [Cyanobacteriota bacterium]